jgi:hypothetical protein
MGRWAQRRRRATGPEIPAAAPVNLIDVRGDGTGWVLTFDAPVSATTAVTGTEFFVGDATQFQCDGVGGALVSGTDNGTGGYVSGLDWFLNAQPAWLNTPCAFPASGTTT